MTNSKYSDGKYRVDIDHNNRNYRLNFSAIIVLLSKYLLTTTQNKVRICLKKVDIWGISFSLKPVQTFFQICY